MYKKHKVPKKIVDKIKQRNKLNKEIEKWCDENLGMEDMAMNSDFADITRSHVGVEQGTDDRREWCDQTQCGEDSFRGDYYWETEYPRQYLHMGFWI